MRCPLHRGMTDEPHVCHPECAWMVDDACSSDGPRRICAVAAIAEALSESSGVVMMGKNAVAPSVLTAVNDWREE